MARGLKPQEIQKCTKDWSSISNILWWEYFSYGNSKSCLQAPLPPKSPSKTIISCATGLFSLLPLCDILHTLNYWELRPSTDSAHLKKVQSYVGYKVCVEYRGQLGWFRTIVKVSLIITNFQIQRLCPSIRFNDFFSSVLVIAILGIGLPALSYRKKRKIDRLF